MSPSTSALIALRAALDAAVRSSRAPGIQYVAVDSASTLLDYAFGWADIAGARALRASTTMMAYSMSKTITAVAVLRLVESGRLRLDDPIRSLMDAEPYGSGVTVRHLLSHTSGIPNPIPLSWVHAVQDHDAFDESAALAQVLRKHGKLASAAGTRYRYSNIGYWLLGRVVERASGQSFVSYVREQVLRPLGITAAELDYAIHDRHQHANGYLEKYSLMNLVKGFLIEREFIGGYEGRWLRIRDHYLNGPAFGGMVGTAGAFAKFLQDQLRATSAILGDDTRQLMFTPERLAGGQIAPMTLGWHVGELAGTRHFYKEGGGGGYHCMMRVYRSRGIGTILMSNATGFDVRALLDQVDFHLMA